MQNKILQSPKVQQAIYAQNDTSKKYRATTQRKVALHKFSVHLQRNKHSCTVQQVNMHRKPREMIIYSYPMVKYSTTRFINIPENYRHRKSMQFTKKLRKVLQAI